MATHALPKARTLSKIGEIALLHGQLDNQIIMLIKDLSGVSPDEALKAHRRTPTSELRKRANALAKQKLGISEALIKVEALLARAAALSDSRNDIIHTTWGSDAGKPVRRVPGESWQRAPTYGQLDAVANDAIQLIVDITKARKVGFLCKALKLKPRSLTSAD